MNIQIIYSRKHLLHHPKWEIFYGKKISHSEQPGRIESITKSLQQIGINKFTTPETFSLKEIYKIHQKNYVDFIKNSCKKLKNEETLYPSFFIIDTYTPLQKGTFLSARESVNCALTGAKLLLNNENLVYSLCRPPGHHAESNKMGGYCYFNNAAIAAQYLSNLGKVVILDIDFHHGNGTQRIFYDRKDVFYISIHADPVKIFPYFSGFLDETGVGEGKGYNKNFPLSLGTGEKVYKKTLEITLNIVKNFNPKFIVVSAGFDTYINDPIGGFKLTIPFYKAIGKEIKSLNIPTLIIQEGGYNIKDLGKLAVSFLEGLAT